MPTWTDGRCRLCGSDESELLLKGGKGSHYRHFHHCRECDIVFVSDSELVRVDDERARYLQHNNAPDDPGYRDFLGNLMDEVARAVVPGARGLDYGCGREMALVGMLREAGFQMDGYDLFFRPDRSVFEATYDFIVCSETAEHFREPLSEFEQMDRVLAPGGVLGVMTAMLDDWSEFPDWHYHRDSTHICYYSPRSMGWLAARFGWRLDLPRQNVAIFHKPEAREQEVSKP